MALRPRWVVGLVAGCVLAALALPASAADLFENATAPKAVATKPPPAPPSTGPTRPGPTSKDGKSPAPSARKPLSGKAAAAGPTWNWQNPLPNGNSLYAISCPTTSTCFAAGQSGPILMTSNGGSTWTRQATASGVFGLSCATALACVGVGNGGLVMNTADGGTTWHVQTIGTGIQFLSGVTCPSVSVCYAVGSAGTIRKTSDGGVSWSPQSSGTTLNLFGVSCPGLSGCVAVGDNGFVPSTTDGGATWSHTYTGAGFGLEAVACETMSCTAVGPAGATAWTGSPGSTWTTGNVGSNPLGSKVRLTGVSCGGPAGCVASGDDGNAYIQRFGAWGVASVGETGFLWGVSCPTTTVCFAAGDYGIIANTTIGGSGWTTLSPQPQPPAPADLHAISCPTTAVCFAVGDNNVIRATTDGGTTWANQTSPIGLLLGVSCPNTTTCFAIGGSGNVVNTTDGGTHWTSQPSGNTSGYAISCPSTTVCFIAGPPGTIFATTDAGSHWVAQPISGRPSLVGISCPTTITCWAVGSGVSGNNIVTTGDGGTTWTMQPNPGGNLLAVSCPSTTTCFATQANGILSTTNSGSTWIKTDLSQNPDYYDAVSCSSPTNCVAFGSAQTILATPDGAFWYIQSSTARSGLFGVSCPSTTTCVGAGGKGTLIRTTNGGPFWVKVAPLGVQDDLFGISCPTTTTCFVSGVGPNGSDASIYVTTNGGTLWRETLGLSGLFANQPSQGQVALRRLSCPTTLMCVVAGGASGAPSFIARTQDGGATWTLHRVSLPGTVGDVSCPTTTVCVAGTSDGRTTTTTDGGATWSPLVSVSTGFYGISCASSTICFLTDGGNIFATSNAGATWSLDFNLNSDPQRPFYGGPFQAIHCPSTSTCNAVGSAGLAATTTDGGANWRTDNIPLNASPASDFTNVTCPAPSICYATSAANYYDSATPILHSSNFGGDWDAQFDGNNSTCCGAGAIGQLQAISCPSTSACFAVGPGSFIVATTTGGAAWSKSIPASSSSSIFSIRCPDNNDCYAAALNAGLVPGGIQVSHDGGSTWALHALGGPDSATAVGCPSITTCYAVGWPGAVYQTVDAGTTWTYRTNPRTGADTTLLGVSCWSSSACVAVGTNGDILSTSNGTTWSLEASYTAENLFGVNCPNSSICIAVGSNGAVLIRSGGAWRLVSSGTSSALSSVSCPTSSTCEVVGARGTVLVSNDSGSTWSRQSSGATYNLLSVDCVQAGVCVAVGGGGTALVTVDGRTWSDASPPTTNTLRGVSLLSTGQAWVAGSGGTILASSNVLPFAARYDLSKAPTTWAGGQSQTFPVTVTNTGTQVWPSTGYTEVDLDLHFATSSGGLANQSNWLTSQAFVLPADVPPGGSVTVNVTVTAPAAGGSLVLEAEMIKEHQFWFAQFAAVNVTVSGPVWSASYDMSKAPTTWSAGQTQTFPVTVTNTGNQIWPSTGYTEVDLDLHFATSPGGSSNQANWLTSQAFALPGDVAPNASVTVNVTVTAPNNAGALVLEAELIKEHQFWFTQTSAVNVTVTGPTWSASYDVSKAPTSWVAGQSQTFPVTVTNTGNQAWPATGYVEVDLDLHFSTVSGGSSQQSHWLTSQAFALPGNVAPSASVTVNVTVTAPTTGGSLVLEAEMIKEHQFWFTQFASVNVTVSPPSWSATYDLSKAPASWTSGQSQSFQVTITNSGNQVWPSTGYTEVDIDFHFTTVTGGSGQQSHWLTSQAFALPSDLQPGGSVTVTVIITAPSTKGSMFLEAEMIKEHQFWFQSVASVPVTVS